MSNNRVEGLVIRLRDLWREMEGYRSRTVALCIIDEFIVKLKAYRKSK